MTGNKNPIVMLRHSLVLAVYLIKQWDADCRVNLPVHTVKMVRFAINFDKIWVNDPLELHHLRYKRESVENMKR